MLFVLELVLSLFEELVENSSDFIRMTFVSDVLADSFLKVVGYQGHWFRCRRGRDLSHELVSVFVLKSRFFKEHVVGSYVEYAVITLIYSLTEIYKMRLFLHRLK